MCIVQQMSDLFVEHCYF